MKYGLITQKLRENHVLVFTSTLTTTFLGFSDIFHFLEQRKKKSIEIKEKEECLAVDTLTGP